MRKIVETNSLSYDEIDAIKSILDKATLPKFIIVETIEENE